MKSDRPTPTPPHHETVSASPANGYEAVAADFMARRSSIGAAIVSDWASRLPRGAAVLDLGCGHGVPITQALDDAGLVVYGVDASPTLMAMFRERFPEAEVECGPAEASRFFQRTFDGVVAWGLLFLLPPATQAEVIGKVAHALKPGGRFLFTAPCQSVEWRDNLTGQTSVSLGRDAYRRTLAAAGLVLLGENDGEGENHYYFARKPETSPTVEDRGRDPDSDVTMRTDDG